MKEGIVQAVVGRRVLGLSKIASDGWNGLVIDFSTAQSQMSQPSSRTEYTIHRVRVETRVVVIMKLGESGCVLKFCLLYFVVNKT